MTWELIFLRVASEKWQVAAGIAALVLWIATVILGLQSLYALVQLFPLILGLLGSSLKLAEQATPGLAGVLGLVILLVVIGTGEYHRTRVGRFESWRLFGVTLGVELAIVILHYFLFTFL